MNENTKIYALVASVAAFSFSTVLLFLGYLESDVFVSDVPVYWENSLELNAPFDQFHPPAYPIIIAIGRMLTFDRLQPVTVMLGVAFAFYLAGALLVVASSLRHADGTAAGFSGVLFLLWPFTGTTYTTYPVADSMVGCVLSLGLYLLLRKQFSWAWLVFAIALVTHKSTWPFAGLLIVAALWTQWRTLGNRKYLVTLVPLPLAALWYFGMQHHGNPLWMFSRTLRADILPRSSFPFFDGLFGPLLSGELKNILKGGIIWAVLGFTILVTVHLIGAQNRELKWYGLAIACAAIFLLTVLNQNTIWAAEKFSKLLVVPAAWVLGRHLQLIRSRTTRLALLSLCALILLATQLVFAWYFAEFFVPAAHPQGPELTPLTHSGGGAQSLFDGTYFSLRSSS